MGLLLHPSKLEDGQLLPHVPKLNLIQVIEVIHVSDWCSYISFICGRQVTFNICKEGEKERVFFFFFFRYFVCFSPFFFSVFCLFFPFFFYLIYMLNVTLAMVSNIIICNFFRIKVWIWLQKDWIHWKTWHMIWMRSAALCLSFLLCVCVCVCVCVFRLIF